MLVSTVQWSEQAISYTYPLPLGPASHLPSPILHLCHHREPMYHFYGLIFPVRVLSRFSCVRQFGNPTRFLCPWDSPGKNTGVGCHALLQGLSNPGIKPMSPETPALQADSLPLSYHLPRPKCTEYPSLVNRARSPAELTSRTRASSDLKTHQGYRPL